VTAVPIVESCAPPDGRKLLALTFDDGPSPNTEKVLDVFRRHGGHATFFVLGERIDAGEQYAELVRRAVAEGHEVGNHTYSHPHLGEHDEATVRDEIGKTAALIEATVGTRPRLFRCPYGEDEERVAGVVAEDPVGAAIVRWSIDPEDWADPPPATIAAQVIAEATSGAIAVLHDGWGRENTAVALETLVPGLQAQGFELVTVSALLEHHRG
jgi:peptidoglycan/xylan/chitin deacetylase (PgdA/CDA1 family)